MITDRREFIIGKFNTKWSNKQTSPTYREVKAKDPELFNAIIRRFNGYKSFIRYLGRPMPKSTSRDKSFAKIASKCSNEHHKIGWSNLEIQLWASLVYLDIHTDFIHNFPFPSPKGRYYKLDFYNIEHNLCIEVDGMFHSAIPQQKSHDEFRDRYLKSCGVTILRLSGNDIVNQDFIQNLKSFLYRHHYLQI